VGVNGSLGDLAASVREHDAVVAVGGRTHWSVGGDAAPAAEVRAPAGIVAYDPAELTVTAGAGTTFADLDAAVRAAGQEVVVDPADPASTLGGALASGLSGIRRLRYGPVRDTVLEVRLVLADGRVVRGGGQTVKNVTGYDVPRLVVGSLGTLAVIAQVTLRCRPRPRAASWFTTTEPPSALLARLYRPSALLSDGSVVHVLLEGHPDDIADQARGLEPAGGAPPRPQGPDRGRISVDPARLDALCRALLATGSRFLAEWGVGTVHVAGDAPAALAAARAAAEAEGGWMLREAGGPSDAFGTAVPDAGLHRGIKDALDPGNKLGRGRIPW
jgi:FAD/FMN-containing dehydrogenase